jgi:hypothetical protein
VCWFLGFTPEHDYTLFEERAAIGELLPSERDEQLLEIEREELDFDLRVGPGLRRLVRDAIEVPGENVRGTVGNLVKLEITATVETIEADALVDLTLIVRVPSLEKGQIAPPGWPGSHLMERLTELATGEDPRMLQVAYPTQVRSGDVRRSVDFSRELVIEVRNWVP